MMDEPQIQWAFFQAKRNFSLAVANSINRCQFETGFSLRGGSVGGFLELRRKHAKTKNK